MPFYAVFRYTVKREIGKDREQGKGKAKGPAGKRLMFGGRCDIHVIYAPPPVVGNLHFTSPAASLKIK